MMKQLYVFYVHYDAKKSTDRPKVDLVLGIPMDDGLPIQFQDDPSERFTSI